MRGAAPSLGETFQARAIDQKNVEPAVVIVIVESDAAAGGFEQIFVFVLASEDGLHVQVGFTSHVEKLTPGSSDCGAGFFAGSAF